DSPFREVPVAKVAQGDVPGCRCFSQCRRRTSGRARRSPTCPKPRSPPGRLTQPSPSPFRGAPTACSAAGRSISPSAAPPSTRIHRGSRGTGHLLDAGILAIGGGLVLWEQMVVPTAAFPLPKFALQVSVAYPVLDVVIFALLAWFVAVASGRNAATGWVVASY